MRQRRVHYPPFVRPWSCSSRCSGVSTEILTTWCSLPTRADHGKWVLTGGLLCRRTSADGAPAEHFAREVDRVIADFADYDRPKHLAAARRVANAEQRVGLRSLPARKTAVEEHALREKLVIAGQGSPPSSSVQ